MTQTRSAGILAFYSILAFLLKKDFPEANFMSAEQTFAWQGRYKKIFNSMTKTHFHFMIHRLIKGRNRYTSRCYKRNRKPLLPSAKVVKSKK